MAIQFARLQYVKRSEGKSAVAAAAYQSRSVLVDPRTGEKYDFTAHGAPEAPTVFLLPQGAAPEFGDAQTLWGAAEISEKRRNSQVAKQLLLALPKELPIEERMHLACSFVNEHFVSKGVAAQLDFHTPHEGSENYHCHVLITTRRIELGKLASHKARDLDAIVRHRQVVEGELWGERWREHQEAHFREKKIHLIVDPVAPYASTTSYGPKRSWRSAEPVRSIETRKTLNAHAARDAGLVIRHFARTGHRVDDQTLDRFLIKHITEPDTRHAVKDKVLELRRAALNEAATQDKVPSGWRNLTIHDVARELSPEYKRRVAQERRLLENSIPYAKKMRIRNEAELEEGLRQVRQRWAQMGPGRRAAHCANLHRDPEIERWEKYRDGAGRRAHRWSIRERAATDLLPFVRRRAEMAFNEIRDAAQRELERRQDLARRAKTELSNLEKPTLYPHLRRARAQTL